MDFHAEARVRPSTLGAYKEVGRRFYFWCLKHCARPTTVEEFDDLVVDGLLDWRQPWRPQDLEDTTSLTSGCR